jgi:uncharacterized membrane protein YhaH (DUF805 family)
MTVANFCPQCQTPLGPGDKICKNCGCPMGESCASGNAQGSQGENLGLFGYFVKCLKNYANFKGRARRKEYWGYTLFYTIIYFISVLIAAFFISMVADLLKPDYASLEYAVILATSLLFLPWLLPMLAVFVRRMHDIDKSGAILWLFIAILVCMNIVQMSEDLIWLYFVVLPGCIYILILLCKKGDVGENEYGLDPKG